MAGVMKTIVRECAEVLAALFTVVIIVAFFISGVFPIGIPALRTGCNLDCFPDEGFTQVIKGEHLIRGWFHHQIELLLWPRVQRLT